MSNPDPTATLPPPDPTDARPPPDPTADALTPDPTAIADALPRLPDPIATVAADIIPDVPPPRDPWTICDDYVRANPRRNGDQLVEDLACEALRDVCKQFQWKTLMQKAFGKDRGMEDFKRGNSRAFHKNFVALFQACVTCRALPPTPATQTPVPRARNVSPFAFHMSTPNADDYPSMIDAFSGLTVSDEHHVYVMQNLQVANLFKVGRAKNPLERLAEGRTWVPYLTLVETWKFPSKNHAKNFEAHMHARLEQSRLRKSEWFLIAEAKLLKLVHEEYEKWMPRAGEGGACGGSEEKKPPDNQVAVEDQPRLQGPNFSPSETSNITGI